ncbi:MAG: S-methyl-5'-thioadenosine phosphorylase [Desulfovibrionaceae bacterium]|jgi:5'-methylthioadenosine phosphorylase|nr:S-methyl-5'-thioadenosine phosphorylase [Desulfovibrionaceae bacterium]
MKTIGIIGGSGLEDPDFFENRRELDISTPYGPPSSPLVAGTIAGHDVILVSRHGREHTVPPTHVNNRAHVWALRELGCEGVLASTAVGSLRRRIDRGHLVVPDQFIDFTRRRPVSFYEVYEPHKPMHTPMADPFDAALRAQLVESCRELGLPHHDGGTVITIEGSRFSTRAESFMFREWGADIINMSTAPECILANEAGLPYAAVAMSTDYDCWKTDEPPVTWEDVLRIFRENALRVTTLLVAVVAKL